MNRDYFIQGNIFLAATITPVAYEVNFPATYIVDDLHYRRWRVATAQAEADFAYTSNQTLREFLLRFPANRDPTDVPHQFGVNDTVTVKLWDTTPAGTLLHDIVYPLSVDPLGYSHVDIGADIVHQYARLTIDAPDLIAAGGQLEIENIFGGVPVAPIVNYNTGAAEEKDDNTEVDIGSFSGANTGEPRARWDSYQRTWDAWTDAQIAWWKDFEQRFGSTRTFVYVTRPHRPLLKRVLIARFKEKGTPALVENGAGDAVIRANIIENR